MFKHTQTIRQLLPTNCLSVYDQFVGLALKGFKTSLGITEQRNKTSLYSEAYSKPCKTSKIERFAKIVNL